MRIATFNTWKCDGDYWTRIGQVGAALTQLDLDVIALQECFFAPAVNADTAQAIAAELGMHLSRAPMRQKVRLIDGAETPSRADLAILTREAPQGLAIARLSPDPRDGERLALRIDVTIGTLQVRIVNVHLTHLRDEAACEIRGRQARETLAFGRSGWNETLVISGDLNDLFGSPALSAFFGDPGIDRSSHASLRRLAASGTSLLAGGGIDHVLAFDAHHRLSLRNREVLLAGAGLSDHPVIVVQMDLE